MVVLGLAGPEGVSLKTGWLWVSVPGFSRPQGLSPWRGFTVRPERCQCARGAFWLFLPSDVELGSAFSLTPSSVPPAIHL